MNKAELIDRIAAYTNLPKVAVESILDAQGKVIANHFGLAAGACDAEVVLPGLGKLKTSTRAARTGRNPQTGAEIQIPERVAVKFSAGKVLDDILNP
ncbi:DNA-binding protein HU-beta [Aromatoleum tolulyticum]|uniref:DNA-binding protein HU-beta n=1 Tax=Aromatoleum tolulyticum TaxID=34027 RepID=A0A1N6WZV7_9RHOO|nr:HU family DNA-binding protein [Aromatoleum tolulyticum]SIQ95622.1 DNA-binding protein HU-beta [Aromatoleum tolulyticum]